MKPFVSVLTPVYNGADFLAECIESVLSQTYENYEYIIVNNCSTDKTLEIANSYAAKYPRIRVVSNKDFVGVIENHNIAFGLMSPEAKYCKIVSADDLIFSECLAKLVDLAEAQPTAALVGCYQLSGTRILWQGFPYPKALISGRDICRRILLEGNPSLGFGTPTSLLYRSDLIRASKAFYPNPSPHADTSACFEQLRNRDFGFVYQVLCYERTHEATQSSASKTLNRYSSAYISDIKEYGLSYLSSEECAVVLARSLEQYYEFLATNVMRSRGTAFWDYHRKRLVELGYPLTNWKLFKAGLRKAVREIANPAKALERLRK